MKPWEIRDHLENVVIYERCRRGKATYINVIQGCLGQRVRKAKKNGYK